ncbi:hypothetical protein OS493_004654 [Desmophyllum pertusum]|uniref:Fibrinogen C-terminal domain-containing protein n=1 Tax=Desmophyllum pertusum TaxID=174260 RepID=A0A9X0D0C1_9CNID|nr:hypothetical protein OS493_004654 [Desmophyllum pertusum]
MPETSAHFRQQIFIAVESEIKGGRRYMPEKDICVNKCCEPNPCFQGGVCREICDPETVRFNCTSCPDDYTGQRCEKIKYPPNCKDIWKNGASTSGKYRIYNAQSQPFLVYCDLESEPEFFWALIQSFSLENKIQFHAKAFKRDYPVDEDSLEVDWALHRLSLSHMQHLAGISTYLRVTCNFHSPGFNYTDYARADFKSHSPRMSRIGRHSKNSNFFYICQNIPLGVLT